MTIAFSSGIWKASLFTLAQAAENNVAFRDWYMRILEEFGDRLQADANLNVTPAGTQSQPGASGDSNWLLLSAAGGPRFGTFLFFVFLFCQTHHCVACIHLTFIRPEQACEIFCLFACFVCFFGPSGNCIN